MAIAIYSFNVGGVIFNRVVPGPPPVRVLGYFHGCPAPQLPPCRIPMPILRNVAARCCVAPPFIGFLSKPWYVVPPLRYVFPPVLVFRR